MKYNPPAPSDAKGNLSLEQKIDRLKQLAPHRVVGLETLVDAMLEDAYQEARDLLADGGE